MASASPLAILIVEDNAAVAESLSELLTSEGYRCTVARSFAEGRAVLERGGVDILVSDHHLGDGHGVDLLTGLDGRRPAVTVLMSALLDETVEERARRVGFHAAVDKHAFTPDLLRALHRAAAPPRPPTP